MKSLFLVLIAFVMTAHSAKSSAGEVDDAKTQLNRLSADLVSIREQGLHFQDEGRILFLKQSVDDVLTSIQTHNGVGNIYTLNRYQQLIIKFRYSELFFEFIRTHRTESSITDALKIVDEIRKRGFEDDPYGKLLKSNLDHMFNSLAQLKKMDDVPADLKGKIDALTPVFAEAIAIADQGDRPLAFDKAKQVYFALKNIYEPLQGLAASPTAFRFVLEVLGINEFLGEYCQIGVTK